MNIDKEKDKERGRYKGREREREKEKRKEQIDTGIKYDIYICIYKERMKNK